MKSFVFSYKMRGKDAEGNDIKSEATDVKVSEAHVNIWKVHVGTLFSSVRLFYDFGLKIHPLIEHVCLFIPFEIRENGKDFDLARKLKDSNQLLCTVFNADLKSDSSPTNCFSKVVDSERNELFCIYQLGANKFDIEEVKIGEKGKEKTIGTLLKIHLQDSPSANGVCKQETPIYIRFRIEPKRVSDAVKSEHISNDFLQDAFSELDLFDFRLNEQRDVHTEAIDKMKGDGFQFLEFQMVHLFFMAETKETVQNGSSIKSDSRLLEKELWHQYIPNGAKDTHYIAHHWKKRKTKTKKEGEQEREYLEPFKDYRIFFTSLYPKTNWVRLFVYLSVMIILSWAGSMLSFSVMGVLNISIAQFWKIIILGVMVGFALLFFIVTNYRLIVRLIRK